MEAIEENIESRSTFFGEWLSLFACIILEPIKTLKLLAQEEIFSARLFMQSAFTVILVSALDGLRGATNPTFALVVLLFAAMGGIILWLSYASSLGLLAWCFGISVKRLLTLYITTGWAFLPWLFMPALSCYKKLLGPIFPGVLLLLIGWVVFLQIIAVKSALKINSLQTLLLIAILPQIVFLVQFTWLIQFVAQFLGLN
jgi:hypothetical protein